MCPDVHAVHHGKPRTGGKPGGETGDSFLINNLYRSEGADREAVVPVSATTSPRPNQFAPKLTAMPAARFSGLENPIGRSL